MNAQQGLALALVGFIVGLYFSHGFPSVAAHVLSVVAYLYVAAALLLMVAFYGTLVASRVSLFKRR
jgi:hypothetical protein